MSSKQKAPTKVQKPEPAHQTAVSETAQVGPDLLPVGLGQIGSLNGLPPHGTARRMRQTAVLQMQRQQGNTSVQRILAGHSQSSFKSNGVPTVQRDDTGDPEEMPSEEEKAAALAAARAAKAKAAQSAAEAQQETDKSRTAKEAEKQVEQQAVGKVEQEKGATEPPPSDKESAPAAPRETTESPPDAEAVATAVPPAPEAGEQEIQAPDYVAPKSPTEDPAFQSVTGQAKTVAAAGKKHVPATTKAAEAAAAAESPAAEIEGEAQDKQVGEMDQAETPGFDAAAFKAQLMERINAMAPKSAKEADEFKENDKLGGLKDEMQGTATVEQEKAKGPMETAAAEAPDTESVEPKPVTPLQPEEAGPEPPLAGAARAAPKPRGKGEVEAPLQADSRSLDQQMAEADVTESQLANSKEPDFQTAVAAKKEAQVDAQTAPTAFRQDEQEQLEDAQANAEATTDEKTAAMHADRTQILAQVGNQQQQGKNDDEQKRAEVGAHIRTIYEETKTKVEAILDGLDQEVSQIFNPGAEAAKQAFEDYVDAEMEAYKEERYGGWLGWARWAKDKIKGMPSAVNAFYTVGRRLFIQKMDAVIDNVVALIGRRLTEAKAEIANGKKRIQEYVNQLPAELQSVGQEAAQDIQGQFDQLEQNVDAKQGELIDSLAQQYQENLQAVDARIEEMKAANRGLVDKALDAIGGAIKTILELKNMLLGVLARVADAVGRIIKDPIGFLGNLISGVKQGLNNFVGNIGTHLKKGLIGWLTGAVAEAGIQLPEKFDLPGIFQLVMQLLGLSFEKIMAKVAQVLGFDVTAIYGQIMELVGIYQEEGLAGLAKFGLAKLIGQEGVDALMQVVDLFQALISGSFGKLWGLIQEHLTNLKEMVFGKIQEFVAERVIKAGITWVISLFNPAGAFIKACKMIYDVIMFFVERGKQIMSLVNAIIDSVAAIASGNIGAAANFIEQSLAKAIPVAISFLSSLLGLGNISQKVQEIIQSVRGLVDNALNAILNSKPVQLVAGFIKKAVGKMKNLAQAGVAKAKGALGLGEDQAAAGDSAQAREKARIRVAKATQQPFKDETELAAAIKPIESDLIPEGLQSLQVKPKADKTGHFDIVARQEEDVGDAQVTTAKDVVDVTPVRDYRPSWRTSTQRELAAIYAEYHVPGTVKLVFEKALSKEGNLYNKAEFDRRHMTSFNDIRDNLLDQIQGATYSEAAITLQNMGHTPKSETNESIQAAAKAVLRDRFNDITNVFVDDAQENQARGRQMGKALAAMDRAAAQNDTAAFEQAKQKYLAQGFDPEPIDYFYDKYAAVREQAAENL
ncbi:MAG: hypothetical protein R6X32_23225 [Chloroflexota bacterium]